MVSNRKIGISSRKGLIAALALIGTAHAQQNIWQWQLGGTNNWAGSGNWQYDPTGNSGLYAFVIGSDSVNQPPYTYTEITSGSYAGDSLQSSVDLLISGGSLSLEDASATSSISGTLTMSGGTLTTANPLTVTSLNWSGGNLGGTGSIAATNAVFGSGSNQVLANTGNLLVSGTATWNQANTDLQNWGGTVTFGSSAVVTFSQAGLTNGFSAQNTIGLGAGIVGGTFINQGTLNVNASVSNQNGDKGNWFETESFLNSGAINVSGSNNVVDLEGANGSTNSGYVGFGGTGNTLTMGGNVGTVLNSGTILWGGSNNFGDLYSYSGRIENSGTLEVEGAGDTVVLYAGYGSTGSQFTNDSGGQINVTGGNTLYINYGEGTTSASQNNGLIQLTGEGDIYDDSAVINNAGQIQASSSGIEYTTTTGITLGKETTPAAITNSGSIVAQDSGRILSYATSFANSGSILSSNDSTLIVTASSFTNTGQISNLNSSFFRANDLTGAGQFTNTSTGQMIDAGTADTQAATGLTMNVFANVVTNYGLIEAREDGVSVLNAGDISNYGTLDAEDNPAGQTYSTVDVEQTTSTGSIQNYGTIEATHSEVSLDDEESGQPANLVVNSGLMTASQSGAVTIYSFSAINGSTGIMNATSGAYVGVATTGTFENDGQITADGAIAIPGHDAAFIWQGNVLNNTGTMSATNGGSITLSPNPGNNEISGFVNNTGTMSATNGGSITIFGGAVTNAGEISVRGGGSFEVANEFTFVNSDEFFVDSSSSAEFSDGYNQDGEDAVTQVDGTLEIPDDNLTLGDGETAGDGGLLTGDGTVDGDVDNASGDVAPGDPHVLTINGSYTQGAKGTLNLVIAGDAGPGLSNGFDQLKVLGSISLAGTIDLSFLNGYTPTAGSSFNLLDYSGSFTLAGPLTIVDLTDPSLKFSLNFAGGEVNIEALATPEPATYLPLACGAAGLMLRRRRRRVA